MIEKTKDGREIIAAHYVQRTDDSLAPCRVVLARWNGKLCVWGTHNLDTDGYSGGSYFEWGAHCPFSHESAAMEAAIACFYDKVRYAEGISREVSIRSAISAMCPRVGSLGDSRSRFLDEIASEITFLAEEGKEA
jgi:hypothetical protein